MKKLNDTFFKAAIASGAIVPPRDGVPDTGGRALAAGGWLMAFLGVIALAVAYWVERG
jgi:hypothetical protein